MTYSYFFCTKCTRPLQCGVYLPSQPPQTTCTISPLHDAVPSTKVALSLLSLKARHPPRQKGTHTAGLLFARFYAKWGFVYMIDHFDTCVEIIEGKRWKPETRKEAIVVLLVKDNGSWHCGGNQWDKERGLIWDVFWRGEPRACRRPGRESWRKGNKDDSCFWSLDNWVIDAISWDGKHWGRGSCFTFKVKSRSAFSISGWGFGNVYLG